MTAVCLARLEPDMAIHCHGADIRMAVLFITLPSADLDVNVHPAKAEVRFKDAAAVRSLLVGALSAKMRDASIMATADNAATALRKFATHPASIGDEATPGNRPVSYLSAGNAALLCRPAACA